MPMICGAVSGAETRAVRPSKAPRTAPSSSPSTGFPPREEFGGDARVRRPSVSLVAQSLRAAGLMRYQRGSITILDRDGLEKVACPCYRIIGDNYRRQLANADCANVRHRTDKLPLHWYFFPAETELGLTCRRAARREKHHFEYDSHCRGRDDHRTRPRADAVCCGLLDDRAGAQRRRNCAAHDRAGNFDVALIDLELQGTPTPSCNGCGIFRSPSHSSPGSIATTCRNSSAPKWSSQTLGSRRSGCNGR